MNFCWLYQKAIAWKADDNPPVPRWVQRHLDGCSGCRRYEKTMSGLTARLREQAAGQRAELPPFLHARVMAAVDLQDGYAQAPKARLSWMGPLLVPTAAAVALTVFLVWDRERPTSSSPVIVSTTQPPAAAPELEQPAATLQLLSWAEQLEHPLEGEMKLVVRDAKSALAALTDQFVPDVLLARNESPAP